MKKESNVIKEKSSSAVLEFKDGKLVSAKIEIKDMGCLEAEDFLETVKKRINLKDRGELMIQVGEMMKDAQAKYLKGYAELEKLNKDCRERDISSDLTKINEEVIK